MLKKPHKLRVVMLASGFCLLTLAVTARLFDLQIANRDHYLEVAQDQQTKRFVVQAERGDILDRRGNPLATSTGTLTVYVNPKYFREPEADLDLQALAGQISYYTRTEAKTILERLEGGRITNLGRQLEPENANKVIDLLDGYEISRRGFWLHRESKRRYPRGLAPHVIGFCATDPDGDNEGLAGLELVYDKAIRGQRVEGSTSRTGISQAMDPIAFEDLVDARGKTLVLTIDAAIQEAAEDALAKTAAEFEADACGAVVMDVNTGAILAMASWPAFENSHHEDFDAPERRNRILTDPLETGSVAKLFHAAMLLDTGKITLDTVIDCEGGYAVVGPRTLRDAPGHTLHKASFREVIRYSSNVGTVKAAQALENDEWYRYLRSFGLGRPLGIDLPGEGGGILYPTTKWTSYSRTSLPMGYEMALTPLQIAAGVSALVNGGTLQRPYVVAEIRDAKGHVVERTEPETINRVIRPATSLLMRDLMEDVVEHGTGTAARIPGYRIGGKTGTTRKSHVFTHREYIASFAGALPIDDPKAAIYCYVDNPSGAYYASQVAAPLFREIADSVILQSGLVPSRPLGTELTGSEAALPNPGAIPSEETATGSVFPGMPDLTGLSMAEARRRLPAGLENVRLAGSGRVADQLPLPGDPVGLTTEVVLVFRQDTPPAASHRHVLARNAGRNTR